METKAKDKGFHAGKATNKVALACHIVLGLVLELAYFLEVTKGARTIPYYIVFSVLALGPVVWEIIVYRWDPENVRLKYYIGTLYMIFYILFRCRRCGSWILTSGCVSPCRAAGSWSMWHSWHIRG